MQRETPGFRMGKYGREGSAIRGGGPNGENGPTCNLGHSGPNLRNKENMPVQRARGR